MSEASATARVLDALDDSLASAAAALAELVAIPSVGGTDAENDAVLALDICGIA